MLRESNILVAQSGGPTTVINASLAGVIASAMKETEISKVFGARNGIQGVINDQLVSLDEIFQDRPERIETLKITPSMFLGSCRYKLPTMEADEDGVYEKIFRIFEENNIRYFFYIGGNDSMDTVAKLSKYANSKNYDIKIMGVPKTIDNDLVCIDHTPGFGSAAKYIATSVLEMAHDTAIYDMESVLIIEIMGRNAGWLTASAALARNKNSKAPQLIYLPEKAFSTTKFIEDVRKQLEHNKQVIVAVSEGIKDKEGQYISAKSSQVDQFGHVMLSGTGKYLETLIHNTIGCKVRSVELNVLQRCAAHTSSLTDVKEAFELGFRAVNAAMEGHTREMMILKRVSNAPYEVVYETANIDLIANQEKKIDDAWINEEGNDVTEEMIEYLRPLIDGELNISYENGLPKYLRLEDYIK
ncbi:6-phosphofructokinase [Lachnospiraceae bacterium KM106-2]|nr:6-phosphofructokinase [Lachnospiraceae bacterium KM106-2]